MQYEEPISISGHLCNDIIITVDEFPPKGESRKIISRKHYFGGGAANIAVGIATLGGTAELIAAVGRDFTGSPYEKHLTETGVKTHLYRSETENCSAAIMINNLAGDQITYFEWGAGVVYQTATPPKRKFLHMATGDAQYNIKAAKNADFSSLDPGQDVKYYTKEELETLFENIDLLICNNFELAIMKNTTGLSSDDLIAKVPSAVITEGKKGSTIYSGSISDAEQIPAVVVDAKDPTGAGDAYRAGLFTALKKGYSMSTACRVGAIVSSFVVEKIGTQTNLPTWDAMTKRFEQFFGSLQP